MKYYTGIYCIRCGQEMSGSYYNPCQYCAKEGVNSNYSTYYNLDGASLPDKDNKGLGIFRFKDFMALGDGPVFSLNEGNTPLMHLDRMGSILGLDSLYIKDESRNPTWSWKDRICAVLVNKAKQDGAPGITLASSGNQGTAAAAYAGKANLPCIIFVTSETPENFKTLMLAYGAKVIVTKTMEDRWTIMRQIIERYGFMPESNICVPPIGSNPYGIDGYKTISYEIYEQLGNQVPDWIICPTGFGDGLYGVYKGLEDLKDMGYIDRIPRLAAAEVFGALETSLNQKVKDLPVHVKTYKSLALSIASGYSTYQAIRALIKSDGVARSSSDDEGCQMQLLLSKIEGIYSEISSVAALVVAQKLIKENVIKKYDKVVAILTSTGLKAPVLTAKRLPEAPFIQPNMTELSKALEHVYDFQLRRTK